MAKKLRWFYFHGDLHKKIHISLGEDIITCWHYKEGRTKKYSYTDVKKNSDPAFRTSQVCKMLARGRTTVEMAIINGDIPAPEMAYTIAEDTKPWGYMWSEDDVLNLHDYLLTIHIGRPRLDGLITPAGIPNRRELRAMMRQGTVFYVKGKDGEFVPTWQAERF